MRTIDGDKVQAFIPRNLPPTSPPLRLDGALGQLIQQAENDLGRLGVAAELLPASFCLPFVLKEIVASAQLDGIKVSLVELLETRSGVRDPTDATAAVEACLEALGHARVAIAREDVRPPISLRLMDQMRRLLTENASEKLPGEIRQDLIGIGGVSPAAAVFVPPPPEEVPALLGALEKYIHKRDELPQLVQVGLIYAQLEMIHPYAHGNGRLGRLLITLLLEAWKRPGPGLLYPSDFFLRERRQYYRRLQGICEGEWESWLAFFLEGVSVIAREALVTARFLASLMAEDRKRILAERRASAMALGLLEHLPSQPIVSVPEVARKLGTTRPTASAAIILLERLGILEEITGRRRDRAFSYKAFLDRLCRDQEAR